MDRMLRFVHVQYCDNKSILVINPAGILRHVTVPFIVYSKELFDGKKRLYIVDEVRSTKADELVFIINGSAFLHSCFTIGIRF